MSEKPMRVLLAKPGLDGHDRGVKILARSLRDAGMEVVYTGLRQTPEMIAEAAAQEDVQLVGLSIHSGAHNTLVPRVMALLQEYGASDVKVVVGGIIPDKDVDQLLRLGVHSVHGPGTSTAIIIDAMRKAVGQISSGSSDEDGATMGDELVPSA